MTTALHRPVTLADVADDNPQMLANHLRMLQAEMQLGFERLTLAIERLTEKFEDAADRLSEIEKRRVSARKK